MTKKPVATISFNTPEFLDLRLSDLVKDNTIQTYLYIKHKAEKDTTKDHIHLFLSPARPIDPLKLRKLFYEPCLTPNTSDLGCLPFQASKLSDWLLYALHYPPYLLRKGLIREFSYNLTDIVSNEQYYILEQFFSDATENYLDNRISLFMDKMKHGDTFGDILRSGLIPPNQIVFYEKLYKNNPNYIGSAIDENGNDTFDIPF